MASATTTSNTDRSAPSLLRRNKNAGQLIASWRLDKGLSPEAMSWAMARAGLGHISGRQIRRIENEGTIPTPRTMFAIASFFDQTPTAIWYGPRHNWGSR